MCLNKSARVEPSPRGLTVFIRQQEREVEPALWKSVYYRPIEEFRRRIKAAAAAGEKGKEPLQKVSEPDSQSELLKQNNMSLALKHDPGSCTHCGSNVNNKLRPNIASAGQDCLWQISA